MKNKGLIYWMLMIVGGMALGQGPGPSPVRTAVVTKELIADVRAVTGSLRAVLSSDIASLESGRIDELLINEGQFIEKDDIIARLDNRRIMHDIDASEAEVGEKRAQIQRIQEELAIHKEEYESLVDADRSFKGSVSRQELRAARLQIVTAEGQISTVDASLATLKAQLGRLITSRDDMELKAPFAGVVTGKFVERGSWVSAGGTVVTLSSNQQLEAWLDIPETVPPESLIDGPVTVEVGGAALTVSGIRVIPKIDERSRNYTLVVGIESAPDSTLMPGMSIAATVPNGLRAEQLLLPLDAISRNGAGYFVFKILSTPEGTLAAPTPVDVIFRRGAFAAIRSSAIQPGDSVIIEGNERLFPMMPVTILTGAQP